MGEDVSLHRGKRRVLQSHDFRGADIRGEDDVETAEVQRFSAGHRHAGGIEDLQEHIEHAGMRLLDFIEERRLADFSRSKFITSALKNGSTGGAAPFGASLTRMRMNTSVFLTLPAMPMLAAGSLSQGASKAAHHSAAARLHHHGQRRSDSDPQGNHPRGKSARAHRRRLREREKALAADLVLRAFLKITPSGFAS